MRFKIQHLAVMVVVALAAGAGAGLIMKKGTTQGTQVAQTTLPQPTQPLPPETKKGEEPPKKVEPTKKEAPPKKVEPTKKEDPPKKVDPPPKKVDEPPVKFDPPPVAKALPVDLELVLKEAWRIPPITPEHAKMLDLSGEKFSAGVLRFYKDDAKDNPFRKAVRDAAEELGREPTAPKPLPRQFQGVAPQDESKFKDALAEARKQAGLLAARYESLQGELDKLARTRAKESLRWQAVYDYVLARLLTRIIYLKEYQAVLTSPPPNRDPKTDAGWQLGSQPPLASGPETAKLAKTRQELLDQIIQEHGDSPFALLADREKKLPLGLKWQVWAR
jgi:hypothetical protein